MPCEGRRAEDTHIEVPLTLGCPPVRRYDQDGPVREVDLDAVPDRGLRDAAARPEVDPLNAQARQNAVHAKLKTVGIRDTANIWLISDTMVAHPSGDGGIEANAAREPSVGIRGGGCRGDGCLARLDLHAVALA